MAGTRDDTNELAGLGDPRPPASPDVPAEVSIAGFYPTFSPYLPPALSPPPRFPLPLDAFEEERLRRPSSSSQGTTHCGSTRRPAETRSSLPGWVPARPEVKDRGKADPCTPLSLANWTRSEAEATVIQGRPKGGRNAARNAQTFPTLMSLAEKRAAELHGPPDSLSERAGPDRFEEEDAALPKGPAESLPGRGTGLAFLDVTEARESGLGIPDVWGGGVINHFFSLNEGARCCKVVSIAYFEKGRCYFFFGAGRVSTAFEAKPTIVALERGEGHPVEFVAALFPSVLGRAERQRFRKVFSEAMEDAALKIALAEPEEIPYRLDGVSAAGVTVGAPIAAGSGRFSSENESAEERIRNALGENGYRAAAEISRKMAGLLRRYFPLCFHNLTYLNHRARRFRLEPASPFSGLTLSRDATAPLSADAPDLAAGVGVYLTFGEEDEEECLAFPRLKRWPGGNSGFSLPLRPGSVVVTRAFDSAHPAANSIRARLAGDPSRLGLFLFQHAGLGPAKVDSGNQQFRGDSPWRASDRVLLEMGRSARHEDFWLLGKQLGFFSRFVSRGLFSRDDEDGPARRAIVRELEALWNGSSPSTFVPPWGNSDTLLIREFEFVRAAATAALKKSDARQAASPKREVANSARKREKPYEKREDGKPARRGRITRADKTEIEGGGYDRLGFVLPGASLPVALQPAFFVESVSHTAEDEFDAENEEARREGKAKGGGGGEKEKDGAARSCDFYWTHLVECVSREVTASQLREMAAGGKLSEAIIRFGLHVAGARARKKYGTVSYAMDSIYFSAFRDGRADTSRVPRDILCHRPLASDLILVPLHSKDHWALLIYDLKKDELRLYDSSDDYERDRTRDIRAFQKIIGLLREEERVEGGPKNAGVLVRARGCGRQLPGSDDCGLFLLGWATEELRGNKFTRLKGEDMAYCRRQLCADLTFELQKLNGFYEDLQRLRRRLPRKPRLDDA